MPEIDAFLQLVNIGVPFTLVMVGLWFGIAHVWPYWKERDAQERQHDYLYRSARLETDAMLAKSLERLAEILALK